MLKEKSFTAIIPRNIGDIDYILPLFKKLKKIEPSIELRFLYLSYSKYSITKKDIKLHKLINKLNIKEIDLLDLVVKNKKTKGLINFFFGESNYLYEDTKEYLRSHLFFSLIKNILGILKLKINQIIIITLLKLSPKKKIFSFLKSDFYFVAHRNILVEEIKNFFKGLVQFNSNSFFFLFPHGPHYMMETLPGYGDTAKIITEFVKNYEFWFGFKHEKPWKNDSRILEEKTFCVGYPFAENDKLTNKNKAQIDCLRILVIPRKFSDEKMELLKSSIGTVTYKEMFNYLKPLAKINKKHQIIIKPHPAASIKQIKLLLKRLKVENYSFTTSPLSMIIDEVDILYAYYSTVILSAVNYRIPVLYYEEDIMRNYISKWKPIDDLYKKITFYYNDNRYLEKKLIDSYQKDNKPHFDYLKNQFNLKFEQVSLERIYKNCA